MTGSDASGASDPDGAGPVLTLLYVPGDRPERVAKALASAADVVIVDLEDAVAPGHKDAARTAMLVALDGVTRPVQVRVNALGTPWHAADVAALADLPATVGARVPKVEAADDVVSLAAALPGRDLHLLLESALGVERAYELACASEQVAGIGLGEADLRSDLGVADLRSDLGVADETGLTFARSRVVLAARAAGLPAPAMSAYVNVRDLQGLRASCLAGRVLGFLGRTAIHPAQLDVITEAFTPSAEEVQRARAVVERVGSASAVGSGTVVLEDGTFLDVAMVEQARRVLAIAERVGCL